MVYPELLQIFVHISNGNDEEPSENLRICDTSSGGLNPPPQSFTSAAGESAGLGLTAEGILFNNGGACHCSHQVTGMAITFYP